MRAAAGNINTRPTNEGITRDGYQDEVVEMRMEEGRCPREFWIVMRSRTLLVEVCRPMK